MGHIYCKDKDGIPVQDALWQSRIEIAERDRQAKMEDAERARQARLDYKEFNDFREYQQRRNNCFEQGLPPYGFRVTTNTSTCSTNVMPGHATFPRPHSDRTMAGINAIHYQREYDHIEKYDEPKSNRMASIYNIILFLLSPLMQPGNAEKKNDDDADRVQK